MSILADLHGIEDLEEVSHPSKVGIHVVLGVIEAERSHALVTVLDMLCHFWVRIYYLFLRSILLQ